MVTPKGSDRGTLLDVQIRNTLDQFITSATGFRAEMKAADFSVQLVGE